MRERERGASQSSWSVLETSSKSEQKARWKKEGSRARRTTISLKAGGEEEEEKDEEKSEKKDRFSPQYTMTILQRRRHTTKGRYEGCDVSFVRERERGDGYCLYMHV